VSKKIPEFSTIDSPLGKLLKSKKAKSANIDFRHRDLNPDPLTEEILIERIAKHALADKRKEVEYVDFVCKYNPALRRKLLDQMEKMK